MGNPLPDGNRGAAIRSFVRRDSRITPAQKTALDTLWPRYALPTLHTRNDLDAAFGRRAPTTLEIGSGDGACTLALADRDEGENFIAVEVYRPGLGRLLNRAAAQSLANIRVSDADICDLLGPIGAPLFDRVLVFFPDPWPKKRHNKRRLLQRAFFELLMPRMQRHGRVFIATDNADYAESIMDTIADLPGWINLAGPGAWAPRAAFRPVTKFEAKAGAAGSQVFDIALARA
ncbi:MAG: tRNA (guanine(46)-N(7))-methyltransferase TrmB [Gammaproteobacteria bacterium]|jgi:tRNA (guanine-N7-)-methyltransferase